MPARYRDRYDEWDDEYDDEWGDDQSIFSSAAAYEEFKREFLNWALYEDAGGIWRCTCRKYQARRKCFHIRYARKEHIVKVKEEYL